MGEGESHLPLLTILQASTNILIFFHRIYLSEEYFGFPASKLFGKGKHMLLPLQGKKGTLGSLCGISNLACLSIKESVKWIP